MADEFGKFSGDPRTRWIATKNAPDRDMELLAEFSYKDPAGRVWIAPKGRTVNGASIPEPLWAPISK